MVDKPASQHCGDKRIAMAATRTHTRLLLPYSTTRLHPISKNNLTRSWPRGPSCRGAIPSHPMCIAITANYNHAARLLLYATEAAVPCMCAIHAVPSLLYCMHKTTPKGFEPLRAEPNGFLVHHLSHSVTLSLKKWFHSRSDHMRSTHRAKNVRRQKGP